MFLLTVNTPSVYSIGNSPCGLRLGGWGVGCGWLGSGSLLLLAVAARSVARAVWWGRRCAVLCCVPLHVREPLHHGVGCIFIHLARYLRSCMSCGAVLLWGLYGIPCVSVACQRGWQGLLGTSGLCERIGVFVWQFHEC
jgi:hypothetical protein